MSNNCPSSHSRGNRDHWVVKGGCNSYRENLNKVESWLEYVSIYCCDELGVRVVRKVDPIQSLAESQKDLEIPVS